MSIQPVISKLNSNIQQLPKQGRVIIQTLTNAPTEKMGGWTMLGYGAPKNLPTPGSMLSRIGEFGKPLNSFNRIV